MSDGDEHVVAIPKRWASYVHRTRKSSPRIYQALDDAQLAELYRQTNQMLAITAKVDHKRFDSSQDAARIRAMSTGERDRLRHDTLITATRIRDEFRRRTTKAAKVSAHKS